MRKKVIIILLLVAIPVYIWDAWLIFGGKIPFENTRQDKNLTMQEADTIRPLAILVFHYKPSKRNPFLSEIREVPIRQNIVPKNSGQAQKKVPQNTDPPMLISIQGIMWNATSPVAIIKIGTETQLVRSGDKLANGMIISAIEKHKIKTTFQGKSVWLESK